MNWPQTKHNSKPKKKRQNHKIIQIISINKLTALMKQSNIVHLKTSILLVKTPHHNTQLNFKINSAIGQILLVL